MNISTSSSFELNSKEAAAGCLSGLLRRILCKNFHPSSNSTEDFGTDPRQEQKKPPPSPGLVARLMGLDTMPVYPYTTPTESISRSRSTNSIEGWNGFLSGQQQKKKNGDTMHRTSQSFREEPTFLRKENEDFLILSFVPDEKGEELSRNQVKPKIDIGELKEMKTKRIERRIEGKENVNSKPLQKKELCRKARQGANKESSSKAKKQREEPRRPISAKKRSVSALKRIESESSSQNSSPVSVLDRQFDGPDSPISEEDKEPKQKKPIKKLSSELKSESYPSPRSELIRNSREEGSRSRLANVNSNRGKSSERKEKVFSDTWIQICQLTEEDVKRSYWDFREIWRLEDNDEIAAVIGLEILDLILNEVITELPSFSIEL